MNDPDVHDIICEPYLSVFKKAVYDRNITPHELDYLAEIIHRIIKQIMAVKPYHIDF